MILSGYFDNSSRMELGAYTAPGFEVDAFIIAELKNSTMGNLRHALGLYSHTPLVVLTLRHLTRILLLFSEIWRYL